MKSGDWKFFSRKFENHLASMHTRPHDTYESTMLRSFNAQSSKLGILLLIVSTLRISLQNENQLINRVNLLADVHYLEC